MRRNLFVLLILVLSSAISSAQECNDNVIMSMRSGWQKDADANMIQGKLQAQVIKSVDSLSKLFISAYPEPKGIKARWYRSMVGFPLLENGPIAYNFNSLYLAWFCDKDVHKLLLGDETGTWAYAFVNNFNWFMSNQYDLLPIKADGARIWTLPLKKGKWKGHTLYKMREDNANCIVLTHDSRVPWKSITRVQYLRGVLAFWEDHIKENNDSYAGQEEKYKKIVAEIQDNRYMKPEDKEKTLADLQKQQEEFRRTKDQKLAKLNSYWEEKIAIAKDYIKHTDAKELNEAAIMQQKLVGDFTGSFTSEERGGQYLVTVDSSYFKSQLPRYSPQFIVLYWKWSENTPSFNFKKEFEENFPVERMQAMMDFTFGANTSKNKLAAILKDDKQN